MKKQLYFAGLTVAMLFNFACKESAHTHETEKLTNPAQKPGFAKAENVCMTRNTVYYRAMMPVKVENKIYYGCCQTCIDNIKENPEKYIYGKDPVSHKKVNKADAVILNLYAKAVYFESKKNAEKFLNLRKNKSTGQK